MTMATDVTLSWKRFVTAIRSLLSDLPEHRHQDQFLTAREAAFELAESEQMIAAFAYGPNVTDKQVSDVVVLEMDAFPLAVSVHQSEAKAGTAKPGARKTLCSAAATILGSVGDVFALTPFGKGVVAILKEAVELGGGG
jgi:hypothetical protein